MLTRRSCLTQVIAMGIAPAIMRIAPPMKIKALKAAYDTSCGVEVMPGVFVHPCLEPFVDEYNGLTVVRNTNEFHVQFFHGQLLRPKNMLVLSKTMRPPTKVWRIA